MDEYIKREAVLMKLMQDGCSAKNLQSISDMPAADIAPVVHGRWDETDWVEMESGGHELIRTPNAALRCSNCCNCFEKELLWKNNYCPNCGAKMDEEVEE